jgi:hypothetical protein
LSSEEQSDDLDEGYAPGGIVFGTDGTDKISVRIGRHDRIFTAADLLRMWAACCEERQSREVP